MQRILITGGLGYVGGRIAKCLLMHGHEVCIGSRCPPSERQLGVYSGASFVIHETLFTDSCELNHFDSIIHSAALNEIDCVKYPDLAIEVNINQTRKLAEKAVKQGVNQFVYLSTAHVYRSPLAGLIDEETLTEPRYAYGITHRAAEDYVLAAAIKGRMKALVLRVSNVFGAPASIEVDRWTLLVNDLCRQAVRNKELKLNSNGCQYRDFITLKDLCRAVGILVDKLTEAAGIFNLGSGKSLKVLEMAQLVQDRYFAVFGERVPICLPEGAVRTEEPTLRYGIGKLEQLGIVPENDFVNELDEMLLFCRANLAPVN